MKRKGRVKQHKDRRYSANVPQEPTRRANKLVYVQVDGKWQPRIPLTEEEEMLFYQLISRITKRKYHESDFLSQLLKDFSHPTMGRHPIFGAIAYPSFEFRSSGIFIIGGGPSYPPDGETEA